MTELVLNPLKQIFTRIDRVWLALIATLAVLALTDPMQAESSIRYLFSSIIDVAPWLVLSVAIAAYAGASDADNLIARAFHGRQALMIFTAALFGGLSPFCSCGVIPLIAALLAMGVPLAPVMAFWLASPIIDPAMFAMTVGTLGLSYAIAKTIAAVGIGLMGGFSVFALSRNGFLADPLRPGVGNGGCCASSVRSEKPVTWAIWRDSDRMSRFFAGVRENGLFLGKWMSLAFVLENLMLSYVPSDFVATAVGGHGLQSIVIATLVGVPAYLNGYAALPLVAGLLQQGMAPGAAIAFMVGGGVSCIPAAVAVWALAKKEVFALYLLFAFTGSVAAGLLFQAVQ